MAGITKKKVKNDAVELAGNTVEQVLGNRITMLPVDDIRPFHKHPFRLYEGECLQDMVDSVMEHGILNPVIVRTYNGTYEMLSGHNRQNAAKIAGIKEIPAIIKEKLSNEEAYGCMERVGRRESFGATFDVVMGGGICISRAFGGRERGGGVTHTNGKSKGEYGINVMTI